MKEDDKKQMAYIMYVGQGITATDVIKALGISRSTMWRWCKNGDWQYHRRQKKIGPTKLTAHLYELAQTLTLNALDAGVGLCAKPAGDISKIASAITKIERRIHPGHVMYILAEFASFLVRHNPELTHRMIPYQKSFVAHMLGKGYEEPIPDEPENKTDDEDLEIENDFTQLQ